MAHVLDRGLTTPALVAFLTAIGLWKALEIAVLGGIIVASPMVAASLLVAIRPKVGMAMLALACLTIVLAPAASGQPAVNHLTWVFWIASTVAIFEGAQQRVALRCQLSIMYGFAALAKLWPEFLSGQALATRTWVGEVTPLWLLVGASYLTLLVEVVLAVGVWLRRPWGYVCFWLAVGLHGSFLLFTVTDPWRIGRLVIFGGLSLAVWLRAARAFPADEVQTGDVRTAVATGPSRPGVRRRASR